MANPIPETTETEEIQRGAEARHLLEHPMIVGALDAIEKHYELAWRQSKLGEGEVREEAFKMLHAAGLFRKLLTKYVETGTLAEASRAQKERQEALSES